MYFFKKLAKHTVTIIGHTAAGAALGTGVAASFYFTLSNYINLISLLDIRHQAFLLLLYAGCVGGANWVC